MTQSIQKFIQPNDEGATSTEEMNKEIKNDVKDDLVEFQEIKETA